MRCVILLKFYLFVFGDMCIFCTVIRSVVNHWITVCRLGALVLWLLFVQEHALCARVPDDSLNVKVYFPCGSSDVCRFPDNVVRLERFIQQFDSLCCLPFACPTRGRVVSSASPEGSIGRNRWLAHDRARSVMDYLSKRSETFRHVAASLDLRMDERTTNSRRGSTRQSQYPGLRFAEVTLHFKWSERDSVAGKPAVEDVLPPVEGVAERDTVSTAAQDTAATDSLRPTERPESWTVKSSPLLFVKSNVAYDLLSFINLAVEVPLGKKWSVEAAYIIPWWHSMRRHKTIQMRYLAVTPRYYFGRQSADYASFFTGLSAGWGQYDLQITRHGVQGELWHVSPVFGYSHHLSRHWKMEYSIAVGYLQTEYRKYTQVSDTPYGDIKVHDYPWVSHTFRGIVPTSVGVSIIYTLHSSKAKQYNHED